MERPESNERICRLCLGTLGYFVNIFDNCLETDNLATKIMRCAAIEVKKFDGLPESACHRCVAKVESSYEFRLLCESSDAKLRRLLLPKILDEERYDDVGREQKQLLNCEMNEQTLNETSSEEITILFVSSKRTSVPRGKTTITSEANESTSEYKRRESICSISKFCCSPEPPLNHQPVLENAIESESEPQGYSVSNQQVHIAVNQCLEYAAEESDQQHFNTDHSSISEDNVQVQCIQEKLSNECYSFASSLENVPEMNPIELHEKQISTHFMVKEDVIQSKESFSHVSTASLEVLSDHAKSDPIVDTSIMFIPERDSSLPLKCPNSDNISDEDAQNNKYETTYSPAPSEHTSYSEMISTTNNASSMNSELMLPSIALFSDQEDVLHSHSRDISKLDCNSEICLQKMDSVNNIGLSQNQSNIKRPLELLRQASHASAENAAQALIMLSHSAENSTSLPDNSIQPSTLSADNLTTKIVHTENVERTKESNTNDLFDTCLTTTLSIMQVENNLVRSVKRDMTRKIVSESSEKTLNNENINVKIKCISGKYSVEKVSDYQFGASTCVTTNHTETSKSDTQAQIGARVPSETKSTNKDICSKRSRVSAKVNGFLGSTTRRRKITEPLSRNGILSEEKSNSADLSRYSVTLTDSVAKFKSSDSQSQKEDELSCKCIIDNSKMTDTPNSEELRNNLLPSTSSEMLVQQKNSADINKPPDKSEVTGTDIHADAFWLVNVGVGRNSLNEQRESAGNISQTAESELYFSIADSGGKSINEKKMCKSNYENKGNSNRKKKPRTKRKHCDSSVDLSDNQHSTEKNSKATCRAVSTTKVSAQEQNKYVKQLANNAEAFSAPNHNAVSCVNRRTKSVHCDEVSSLEERKSLARPSESEISKVKKQNGDIYGLSVNCVTNKHRCVSTATSTNPVNSNNSKIDCKMDLPLKELRVLLVRLEIDNNGHYLNSGNRDNIYSESSQIRLQRQASISNNSQQNTLSNSCAQESSAKRQTLRTRPCSQKSENLEAFGAASTKVSYRRDRRHRHKSTIRTAKKRDKTSKILTTSQSVPSSSVPNSDLSISAIKLHKNQISKYSQKAKSRLPREDEFSNRSADDSNRVGWKPPGINLENSLNTLVETRKARRNVGIYHDATSKVTSPFDNMKKTEKSKQHCSEFSKEQLVTSTDSGKTTSNSQVQYDASYNLIDKMAQLSNYKMASNKNDIYTNICSEINNLSSSKCRESSVVSNANKQSHKGIRKVDFKLCEQVNNQSNNHESFTPSQINNDRSLDVAKNYDCAKGNVEVSKCNNASLTKELNNRVENITPRPTGREKCRKSKTLTIESYRKRRQSELSKTSKLNTSNDKHDMNIVQAYASCFSAKTCLPENANTMYRHTGTKANITPSLERFYADQKEFAINNSISSLNHSINSNHTNLESGEVPRNFLENLCITNEKEMISFNEKYKASDNSSSMFHKDKRNKCQQILQSANHSTPAYKQMIEKCKNIIYGMKTTHHHNIDDDNDDDEQCKIIRKEILKSAYKTPQIAVVTADSPIQTPTCWFAEKHAGIGTVLSTVAKVRYSPLYNNLKNCESIENVVPAKLHENEYHAKISRNKNRNTQTINKNPLEMETGIPHLNLKESNDPSKDVIPNSKLITNEKADIRSLEVEINNSISLNEHNLREKSEQSGGKCVTSSSTLKEQLCKRKYDTVLQNRSLSIYCSTSGPASLSSQRTSNEAKRVNPTVQHNNGKDTCFVENLSTAFLRDAYCYVKPIGNGNINAKSKVANSMTIHDSIMEENVSGIRNGPNTLNVGSSWEKEHDAFRSDATSENIFGNVTSVDNSAEHKPRKDLKWKNESNEENVVGTSEQGKSSNTKATVQAGLLIEKEASIPKVTEHICSDDPVKKNISYNYATQDVQERTVHQNRESSTLHQSTETNNPVSLSFSEVKSQETFSNTFDSVIAEGEPESSADKNSTGQISKSVVFDPHLESPSIDDTHFVPDYELSDSNSRPCSENNSQAAVNQGHLLMFPANTPHFVTPFESSFANQLRRGKNISSNNDKNNENRAPKRVCYTSNFIRKDLCNHNVLPNAESKQFVQSKVPFSFGKATRIDKRSKSLESRSNNKPDSKLRMNLICRKSETIYTKFRGGNALREISHQQGENDRTILCEQKLTSQSVSTSVSSTAKSTFVNQSVSKNISDAKNTSEINPDIDHRQTSDTLNLFNCKNSSSLNSFTEEIKTRAVESTRKVNASFLSKYLDKKSSYITPKKCKLSDWVEANSLFALKGKYVFSSLPDNLTRSVREQIEYPQKTESTKTNTLSLQKKRNQMNTAVNDIRNERLPSQHCFIKHQQLRYRERPYTINNYYYKMNGAVRDQPRVREAYPLYKRTNGPLRQCWRAASDTNARFRTKRNGRQPFYRRTGARNNGNGALSRLNENLPNRQSKRCKTCGRWFANAFQFSRHFKRGCNSLQSSPIF